MKKKSYKIIFILEIIFVIIGMMLILLSNNKIIHIIGIGLFFIGGVGLVMKWMSVEGKGKSTEKYVKICPNCGSTKIKLPHAGMDMSMTNKDYCVDCKYGQMAGMVFPEVKETEVEKFRKSLKDNKKKL